MNTLAIVLFLLGLSVCTLLYCIVPLILKYKNGAYCFKDSLQIAFINCIISTMILYAFLLYMNSFNVNIIPLVYLLVDICILNIGYNKKHNNVQNTDFGFCTKCGADLDYNKRCTNCGTQYVNTNHLFYIFLVCSILVIIVFSVIYFYSKLDSIIVYEDATVQDNKTLKDAIEDGTWESYIESHSKKKKTLKDAIEDGTYYKYFTNNQ